MSAQPDHRTTRARVGQEAAQGLDQNLTFLRFMIEPPQVEREERERERAKKFPFSRSCFVIFRSRDGGGGDDVSGGERGEIHEERLKGKPTPIEVKTIGISGSGSVQCVCKVG